MTGGGAGDWGGIDCCPHMKEKDMNVSHMNESHMDESCDRWRCWVSWGWERVRSRSNSLKVNAFLRCVAACCSVMRCVAVCCSVLQKRVLSRSNLMKVNAFMRCVAV